MKNKIIVSLDDSNRLKILNLVRELRSVEDKISGYKVGSLLVMRNGVDVINSIRDITDIPIIYDGQKLGGDIQYIVGYQVRLLSEVMVGNNDKIIIAPMGGGREVLRWFADICYDYEIDPVCVIGMSHLASSSYMKDGYEDIILDNALLFGIEHLVYPATKPKILEKHNKIFGDRKDIVRMATAFYVQSENISVMRELGVTEFIIGRSIYTNSDPVGVVNGIYSVINE